MKYIIKVNNINTVDEIQEYWSEEDYIRLLEKFNYPDGGDSKSENLRDLLFMAITDFEPTEAASIILQYKLDDVLSQGQIDQISNDMLIDTVCEEYPEMELQSTLFHINQLLFKAYNGKFPSSSATIIHCSISPKENSNEIALSKTMVLRLFYNGLSERNIVKRLFEKQMTGKEEFSEANNIIWNLKSSSNNQFEITTSGNLIKKDDVIASEWEGEIEVDVEVS